MLPRNILLLLSITHRDSQLENNLVLCTIQLFKCSVKYSVYTVDPIWSGLIRSRQGLGDGFH